MTLILTVNGPETIWLLADRRLSYRGRPVKEDARKIMFLETADGVAILGYAGLGATALGTEPADWMSAVLRTRNLQLEQSLGVLADAMEKELPRHLVRAWGPGGPVHNLIVPAFVGKDVRLYTVDLAFAPDRKNYQFRYTRHVHHSPPLAPRTPRIAIGGSGMHYLLRDKKWIRSVLRLVRAHDRKQVRAEAVADCLAELNYEVHLATIDNTVGPNCIVAWRHRTEGVHKGGGGHQAYLCTKRLNDGLTLPIIANGADLGAIVQVMTPHMTKQMAAVMDAMKAGLPTEHIKPDEAKLNAELARLPDKPDENLR